MAKVPLNGAEIDVPVFNAGVFEDCEEEVRRLIAYVRNPERDRIPLGKDMAAIVTVSHRGLLDVKPELTRADVQKAVTALTFPAFVLAIAEGMGFKSEGSSEGEASSPPTST